MTDAAGARGYTAVILAGGAAKRLGGVDKATLPVGGVPMIARVLDAVRDAAVTIVVGPPGLPVPPDVLLVREQPAGGGPVAGLAAAFQSAAFQSSPDSDLVGVFAADMPLLTNEAVERLIASAKADGAVFVDDNDHEQWLCGMWRIRTIADRLAELEPAGASLRRLFTGLDFARVHLSGADGTMPQWMPPWFDCDTQDDIRRVEEWLTR